MEKCGHTTFFWWMVAFLDRSLRYWNNAQIYRFARGAPLSLLIASVIVAIVAIPKKKTSSPYVKEKRKAGTRAGLTKPAIVAAAAKLIEVFAETDPAWFIGIEATRLGRSALVVVHGHDGSETRVVDLDRPTAKPMLIAPRRPGLFYDVMDHGDCFYIRTNAGARDFRIVVAPREAPSPTAALSAFGLHPDTADRLGAGRAAI